MTLRFKKCFSTFLPLSSKIFVIMYSCSKQKHSQDSPSPERSSFIGLINPLVFAFTFVALAEVASTIFFLFLLGKSK